jgi:predicted transposase YbfD/YdcC
MESDWLNKYKSAKEFEIGVREEWELVILNHWL